MCSEFWKILGLLRLLRLRAILQEPVQAHCRKSTMD